MGVARVNEKLLEGCELFQRITGFGEMYYQIEQVGISIVVDGSSKGSGVVLDHPKATGTEKVCICVPG